MNLLVSIYRTMKANTLPNQPKLGWRWWYSGPYHENPCLITRFEPYRECLGFREAVSFQRSQAKEKIRASGRHQGFLGISDSCTVWQIYRPHSSIEWFLHCSHQGWHFLICVPMNFISETLVWFGLMCILKNTISLPDVYLLIYVKLNLTFSV